MHDVLKFLGHLLLDVNLDPPEQERPQHLVEPLDQALVVLLAALDHPRQRVGEPFFELAVGLEDVWHEEVHQGPQLHQTVLQRGSRQQQAPVAATHTGKHKIGLNVNCDFSFLQITPFTCDKKHIPSN